MKKKRMIGTVLATAVGALAFTGVASADPVMPGNPVSGWLFDGNYEDAFGGNHGNAPFGTGFTDGPFAGQALNLNGADEHVNFGNPASLRITEAITVATWVNTEQLQNDGVYPLAKYATGTNDRQWALQMQDLDGEYNNYRLMLSGSGTSFTSRHDDAIAINTGTWRHLAFTRDSENFGIYVDGQALDPENLNVSHFPYEGSPLFDGEADIVAGARSDLASGSFYGGALGETAIWDSALSADEIAWLSQNSIAAIPEPGSLALLGAGAGLMLLRRRK